VAFFAASGAAAVKSAMGNAGHGCKGCKRVGNSGAALRGVSVKAEDNKVRHQSKTENGNANLGNERVMEDVCRSLAYDKPGYSCYCGCRLQ
jgi:hypothetical protein